MLTPEQKEARLSYITGTDAAIICEISQYTSPYKLWEYKTRRAIEPDISEKPAVKAGNMLEGAVRDWLAYELNKEIVKVDELQIHKDYPWMAGNIDGLIKDENTIVEIKTTSQDAGWGESQSNEIPDAYMLQVQHYLAVTGASKAFVAVLIRGVDFRYYCIPRDEKLIDYLIKKEAEFWECVRNDTPPPITHQKDILPFNYDSSEIVPRVVLDEEIKQKIEEYISCSSISSQLEKKMDEIKTELILKYGNSILFDHNGRELAKISRVKGRQTFDTTRFKKEHSALYNDFIKTNDDYFKLTFKKV